MILLMFVTNLFLLLGSQEVKVSMLAFLVTFLLEANWASDLLEAGW